MSLKVFQLVIRDIWKNWTTKKIERKMTTFEGFPTTVPALIVKVDVTTVNQLGNFASATRAWNIFVKKSKADSFSTLFRCHSHRFYTNPFCKLSSPFPSQNHIDTPRKHLPAQSRPLKVSSPRSKPPLVSAPTGCLLILMENTLALI